jgi:phospholipase C
MAANRLCTAAVLASIATQAAAAPLTLATSANSAGAGYQRPQAETLPPSEKRALLRQQIKYVFIIFQENRSFDSYFGTYPGANGLFETYPGASPTDPAAQPARMVASFHQHIRNTDGTFSTISPFLAPRIMRDHLGRPIPLYPESA